MASEGPVENPADTLQLKRELGWFSASNFIVSTMIGSGIFVSSSSALLYSGSVGLTLIIWLVAGLICFLGALVYAELGSVVPRSGAEYVFYMEAFAPKHTFWGPLPGFLYSFVIVILVRPVEVAVITLASAEYIMELVHSFICIENPENTVFVRRMVALLELSLMTYINATSVKLYVRVQNVFTFLKLSACLIIIGGGIYELCKGNTENISTGFEGTNFEPKNIALAIYSGLWAYDGWACITNITEEVKKPEVNVLRSILTGIPIVIGLYLLINLSYVTVLTKPEMSGSVAVAMTWGDKMLGSFAPIMPLGVAISAFGCAMAMQFGVARLCYVSAFEGHLPESFSFVHIRRLTPNVAVIIQGAIAMFVLLVGEILELIEFATFMLWLSYGFAMVAMIVLRKTHKDAPRPFKAPISVAVLVILVSLFLSITPIVTAPSLKYLLALLMVVVGVILYIFFVYKDNRPKCMNKFTYVVQVICEAAMPGSQLSNSVPEETHNKVS